MNTFLQKARRKPRSFDNLVDDIENWAVTQRDKGVDSKAGNGATAAVAADDGSEQKAQPSSNNALFNGRQRKQSTGCCDICGGMHRTQECHQLLNVNVDAQLFLFAVGAPVS